MPNKTRQEWVDICNKLLDGKPMCTGCRRDSGINTSPCTVAGVTNGEAHTACARHASDLGEILVDRNRAGC